MSQKRIFSLRHWLILFLIWAAPVSALKANHLSGTHLSYEHVSGDTYLITLTVFLNCGESPLSNTLSVSALSSCGFVNIDLQVVESEEVSQLCSAELPNSGCSGGPLPGVEMRKYQAEAVLTPCADWEIFRTLCNRTLTENVDNSSFPCYKVTAFLDNSLAPNSAPTISVYNIPYVCMGQEVQFNAGFYESDGDSLSYAVVAGRDESNNEIIYTGAYSGSAPIDGISINSQTGQIEFTPTLFGRFTVVIEVREYRNGVLVGIVRHDFLFIVEACSSGPPVFSAAGVQHVSGGGYPLDENTIGACAGDAVCFSYTIDSPLPAAIITATTNAAQILPGSTVTVTGTNPATIEICATLPADFSSAEVILSAHDNNCPVYGQNHRVVRLISRQPLRVGNDTLVCTGEPVPLQAANSGAYTWQSISGAPLTAANISCTSCQNPIFTTSETTTLVVTGNYPNSSCANTDTLTVTTALDTDTSITPDACTQGTGAIAVEVLSGSGSYSITWDDQPAAGFVRTSLFQGTYTAHVTDDVLLCTKTLDFYIDDHFPAPQDAGLDTSVCGLTYQLQPEISALPGMWSGPAGVVFSDAASANTSVTVPAPGSYLFSRTVVDPFGCEAVDSVEINFLGQPLIDLGNDTLFCGPAGEVAADYSAGTLTWYSDDLTFGGSHDPSTTVSTAVSGIFQAVAVVQNGFCTASDTLEIIFVENPVAQAPADTVVCGSSVNLTGFSSSGYGQWLATPQIQWQNISGSAATAAASSMGSFSLVWQAEEQGCISEDTVEVTFAEIPQIANIDDSILICGTEYHLFPEFTGGWPQWEINTALQVDSLAPAEYVFSGSYGLHPVELVLQNNYCQASNLFTLNLIEMPEPQMPDDFQVCGLSAEVMATAMADTVYWLSQNGIAYSAQNSPQTLATAADHGVYELTIVAGNGDFCFATGNVQVQFLAPPTADAGPDTAVCSGGSVTLGSTAVDGYQYAWSGSSPLPNPLEAQPQLTFENTSASAQSYTYTVSVIGGLCSSTDTATITVNPLPDISINAERDICTGESVLVSAIGGLNHQWAPAAYFASPEAASTTLMLPFSQNITLQAASSTGCVSTDTVFITVHEKPTAHFTADVSEGCIPLEVNFTRGVNPGNENAACEWNFGNGWKSTSCGDTDVEYTKAGQYTPSLKITSVYGCENIFSLPEPVIAGAAIAKFSMEPEELDINNSTAYFQNLSGKNTLAFWQIGNLAQYSGSELSYSFPTEKAGTYEVCLFVTDTLGCMDTKCEQVKVKDDFYIYVPNSFTPNGDGLNDLFFPVMKNVDALEYHFWITDRKGVLVFETTDIDQPWNGSGADTDYYGGNAVYLWHLTVKPDVDAAIRIYNGTVTLVR